MNAVFVDVDCLNNLMDELIVSEDVTVLFLPVQTFCCLFFFRSRNSHSLYETRQALIAQNLFKCVEESFDWFCLCVLYTGKDSAVLLFPFGFCRHYVYNKPLCVFDNVTSIVGMVQISFIQETYSVVLQSFYNLVCKT